MSKWMSDDQKIAVSIAQIDMRLFVLVTGMSSTQHLEDLGRYGHAVTLTTRAMSEASLELAKSMRSSIMQDLRDAGALTDAAVAVLDGFDSQNPAPRATSP